jgi:hypothetical protein
LHDAAPERIEYRPSAAINLNAGKTNLHGSTDSGYFDLAALKNNFIARRYRGCRDGVNANAPGMGLRRRTPADADAFGLLNWMTNRPRDAAISHFGWGFSRPPNCRKSCIWFTVMVHDREQLQMLKPCARTRRSTYS